MILHLRLLNGHYANMHLCKLLFLLTHLLSTVSLVRAHHTPDVSCRAVSKIYVPGSPLTRPPLPTQIMDSQASLEIDTQGLWRGLTCYFSTMDQDHERKTTFPGFGYVTNTYSDSSKMAHHEDFELPKTGEMDTFLTTLVSFRQPPTAALS